MASPVRIMTACFQASAELSVVKRRLFAEFFHVPQDSDPLPFAGKGGEGPDGPFHGRWVCVIRIVHHGVTFF
jgi:hypothetical protein